MATRPDPDTPRREQAPAAHAYDGLDRVLHEKARLGILTALLTRTDGVSFVELRRLCSLTDGNLNRHLAVLQDAGFVGVQKSKPRSPERRRGGAGEGARVRTAVSLTPRGRRAFLAYLDELERVVRDARAAVRTEPDSPSSGWAPA
jgi:DNA-binding MarR family transcriptional regulator